MPHEARPLRSTRRLQNLLGSLPKWYSFTNSADPAKPTVISIYDEIGLYGVPAAPFLDELRQVKGDIELHVHSPGGDIYEGLAIYNGLLQARKRGTVSVVVDGLAASAASFIAMAASPGQLEIAPHAEMMIHDGFCMGIGNAADMRELADQLDRASDNIAGIYADRTGKPKDYWREKMRAETWYTDQQAVAEGLADRVHGQADAAADDWDLSVFAKYAGVKADAGFGGMLNTVRPDAPVPPAAAEVTAKHGSCPKCSADTLAGTRFCAHCGTRITMADLSGWVQDPDGSWRFDPDGDGDDDSTPEGDTDHDYFDENGKQIKPIPPCPGSVGNLLRRELLNADFDNSEWDASKAWAAGAASDDPAAFYKGICAGRKSGDPDNQSSWALPYKYSPSSKPNAAAVRNALARIGSTKGLTNKDEAQALLERLMKQINPSYEADDLADPGLLAAALLSGLERG